MKKVITLILSLAAVATSYAQGQIFKTYGEYLSKTGEAYNEESLGTGEGGFIFTKIVATNANGNTVRYRPDEIWGFTFKSHLFRTAKKGFAMLKDTGKVCFYVNGIAAIEALRREDANGKHLGWSPDCFLSVGSINSKLYGLPVNNWYKNELAVLKKEHPELQSIIDCAKGEPPSRVRGCVLLYNQTH
jgi:hypothetical protein